jgi:hypothetical protein
MTPEKIVDYVRSRACVDWRRLFDFTQAGTFFQPLPRGFGIRQRVSDRDFLEIGNSLGWVKQ